MYNKSGGQTTDGKFGLFGAIWPYVKLHLALIGTKAKLATLRLNASSSRHE